MSSLSDYLFTPKDAVWGIRRAVEKASRASKYDWIGFILLFGLGAGTQVFFEFSFETTFFWLFAATVFYWKIEARVAFIGILCCLIVIPVFLFLFHIGVMTSGEEWAERAAIWAFYFLIIGVAKLFVEHWRDYDDEEDELDQFADEVVPEYAAHEAYDEYEQIESPPTPPRKKRKSRKQPASNPFSDIIPRTTAPKKSQRREGSGPVAPAYQPRPKQERSAPAPRMMDEIIPPRNPAPSRPPKLKRQRLQVTSASSPEPEPPVYEAPEIQPVELIQEEYYEPPTDVATEETYQPEKYHHDQHEEQTELDSAALIEPNEYEEEQSFLPKLTKEQEPPRRPVYNEPNFDAMLHESQYDEHREHHIPQTRTVVQQDPEVYEEADFEDSVAYVVDLSNSKRRKRIGPIDYMQ